MSKISSKNMQENAVPYVTAKQTTQKSHISCNAHANNSASFA